MTTTEVAIAETNISASQMKRLFDLAATPGSYINQTTLQAYLAGRNPFGSDRIRRIEGVDSAEYSLDWLDFSLHPKQEADGTVTGHDVWEYQQQLGVEACLGLADLVEIRKLGLAAFRRHFHGKAVFAWKLLERDRFGDLRVPNLFEHGGEVVQDGRRLCDIWYAHNPALRFAW